MRPYIKVSNKRTSNFRASLYCFQRNFAFNVVLFKCLCQCMKEFLPVTTASLGVFAPLIEFEL